MTAAELMAALKDAKCGAEVYISFANTAWGQAATVVIDGQGDVLIAGESESEPLDEGE